MFAKLAARNVKRQIGNYLIYFITVSLTVALMFAINNVIYNDQLQRFAETIGELRSGLTAIVVFVALIVAFVLGYATSFMLRLRKREFGTYLTLGMTRKNILAVFTLETMLLCIAALGIGLLLGFFLYQGMMMIMTSLMEMEFAFAAYSVKGLLLTVILVCGMFLLASLTSALYLKRVSIYHLIHGDKMVEKGGKHPLLWLGITLLSLAAVVVSILLFGREIDATFRGASGGGGLFIWMTALAAALVFFHIGLARSVVNLLLKCKRLRARGTNTFTLRQLSGKLSANAVMAGILAFLIAFAIIGANVSFVQKVSEQASLEEQYPFDITANLDPDEEQSPIRLEQAEAIISRYARIAETIPYTIYTTGANELYSHTGWSGEGYEGLTDSLIKESEFNRLLAALGRKPIRLHGGFHIFASTPHVQAETFESARLQLGGKTYRYEGFSDKLPLAAYVYFLAVVPDEAVRGLPEQMQCAAIDLQDGKFDATGLRAALSYRQTQENGLYTFERCDYGIKEYGRIQRNSNTAIFVVGALYIAVVFVFMAMAILALKTLSGLSDDQRRYGILYRLGAGEREQSRTLFRQTFSFFFLPFALPLLLSVPTASICGRIMRLGGYAEHIGEVYGNCAAITLAVLILYVLYFTATYLIAKRNIVRQ